MSKLSIQTLVVIQIEFSIQTRYLSDEPKDETRSRRFKFVEFLLEKKCIICQLLI